jgi:hypothetical protein
MVYGPHCYTVHYWDCEWAEVEELRVEDATLMEAMQALETATAYGLSMAVINGESPVPLAGVTYVTVEVSLVSVKEGTTGKSVNFVKGGSPSTNGRGRSGDVSDDQ